MKLCDPENLAQLQKKSLMMYEVSAEGGEYVL